MNATASRLKKSPASNVQRKSARGWGRRASRSPAPRQPTSASSTCARRPAPVAAGRSPAARLRRESRAWWHAELSTQLERDTLLTPEWVAESVVREAERFLNTRLPDDFVERLAAKAYYLYPRHQHFRKELNRRGNGGREMLYRFMRHWTVAWLKRERYALYQKLPWSFSLGRRLAA